MKTKFKKGVRHLVEMVMSEDIAAPAMASNARHAPNENMFIWYCREVATPERTVLTVVGLCLLGDDEAIRTAYSVVPTDKTRLALYQGYLSDRMHEDNVIILVVHSHPFQNIARLSAIDEASIEDDYQRLRALAGADVRIGWVVFGKDGATFDGVLVREGKREPIEQITVVGSKHKILRRANVTPPPAPTPARTMSKVAPRRQQKELFARHRLIPRWDQEKLGNCTIGLVAAGGTGSNVLQGCLLSGIAREGTIYVIDKDTVSLSNLPRLVYATEKDVGRPKALVAKAWVERLRPKQRVVALHGDALDPEVQRALAGCDLIVGAADEDLARLSNMHVAREHLRPYFDLGAGVSVNRMGDDEVVVFGGQVRVFIPTVTPCIACAFGGIDQTRVNREIALRRAQADSTVAAALERTGYLVGNATGELGVPSVHHVNAAVAAVAVDLIIQYLLSGLPEDFSSCVVDLTTPILSRVGATKGEMCPFCGRHAHFGQGRLFQVPEPTMPAEFLLPEMSLTTKASATLMNTVDGEEGAR